MRIFVYEHLTAVGPEACDPGMYREGKAMRDAVAEDFARIPDVEVFVFPEADSPVSASMVAEASGWADWTLLIAPETDDCLAALAELVVRAGGRLLGPTPEAIRLTTDKFALFEHWRTHRVPTPATSDREISGCEAFPVVWKPRDGAGSTLTFLLQSPQEVVRALAIHAREGHTGPMILQEFVPGLAASVAFLCGAGFQTLGVFDPRLVSATPPGSKPNDPGGVADISRRLSESGEAGHRDTPGSGWRTGGPGMSPGVEDPRGSKTPRDTIPLLPASQWLSDDGRFSYRGGELPLAPELCERAIRLGRRAVACVPGLRGYVGVDLVLGEMADGSRDYAIEINPRLTTSYVGLRRLAEANLAEAMLKSAMGENLELRWKPAMLRFEATGEVHFPALGSFTTQ